MKVRRCSYGFDGEEPVGEDERVKKVFEGKMKKKERKKEQVVSY